MSAGFYKTKTASTPKTNAPSPSITLSSIEATSSLKISNKAGRHDYGSSSLSDARESKERFLAGNKKKSTKKLRCNLITPDERRKEKKQTKRHEKKREVRRQIENSSSSEENWQTTREITLSSDENDRREKSIETAQTENLDGTENIFYDNSEEENFPRYLWEKPPEAVRDAPKNAESVQNILEESFNLISNRRSGRASSKDSNDGKFVDSDDSALVVEEHERFYPAPIRSRFLQHKSKLTTRQQMEWIDKNGFFGVVNRSEDKRHVRNRELMMGIRNPKKGRLNRSAKRRNERGKKESPACETTTTRVVITREKRPIYAGVSPIQRGDGTLAIYDPKNEKNWRVVKFFDPLAIRIGRTNRHDRKYDRGNNEPEARSVSMKSIGAASGSRSEDRVSRTGSFVEKRIVKSDRYRRRAPLRRNDESPSSEESEGERSKKQFHRSGRKIARAKRIARRGEIVRASCRKEKSGDEKLTDFFDRSRLKGSSFSDSVTDNDRADTHREESTIFRDRRSAEINDSSSKSDQDFFRYAQAKIDVDSDWRKEDYLTRPLKRRRANKFDLFPLQSSSGYPVEKIPIPASHKWAFDEESVAEKSMNNRGSYRSIDASKSRKRSKKTSAFERTSEVVKKHRRIARLIYSDSSSSPEVSPKIVANRSENSGEKSRDKTLSMSSENIQNESDNSITVRQSDRTNSDPEEFSEDRLAPSLEAPHDNHTLDTILEEMSFELRNSRRKPPESSSYDNSSSLNRSSSSGNSLTLRSSLIFSDPVAIKCAPDRWRIFDRRIPRGKKTRKASRLDD